MRRAIFLFLFPSLSLAQSDGFEAARARIQAREAKI